MATRNQIARAQLLESKRSNMANEDIKRQQLAEEVSNNLRNFRINLDKNEINRLYNDQLNERELQKIKNNLTISLKQLAQDSRANDIKAQLNDLNLKIAEARNDNEIKKSLLNGIIGLITGATIVAAKNARKDDDTNYPASGPPRVASWINESFEQATKDAEPQQSVIDKIGKVVANIGIVSGLGALIGSLFGTPVYATSVDQNSTVVQQGLKNNKSEGIIQYDVVKEVADNKGVIGKGVNRILDRQQDVNEIPTDVNSAKNAPDRVVSLPTANQSGYSAKPFVDPRQSAIIAPSTGRGPGESKSYYEERDRSRNSSTSGGTNYHLQGGIKSSGVIISPGANI